MNKVVRKVAIAIAGVAAIASISMIGAPHASAHGDPPCRPVPGGEICPGD